MTNTGLARKSRLAGIARRAKHAMGPWGVFLEGFFRHPVMVGSIIPSSARTIKKVLAPVGWADCQLFVEYGPGVGTFSRAILDRLPRDATYLAIDTNPLFIEYLERSIADGRMKAVHGSAADVEAIVRAHGFEAADYVLSGLPFSTLPEGVGPEIAAATHRILRPGGGFLAYQFTSMVRDLMVPHFARIDNGFELFNVLPCKIYWGWKQSMPTG